MDRAGRGCGVVARPPRLRRHGRQKFSVALRVTFCIMRELIIVLCDALMLFAVAEGRQDPRKLRRWPCLLLGAREDRGRAGCGWSLSQDPPAQDRGTEVRRGCRDDPLSPHRGTAAQLGASTSRSTARSCDFVRRGGPADWPRLLSPGRPPKTGRTCLSPRLRRPAAPTSGVLAGFTTRRSALDAHSETPEFAGIRGVSSGGRI